AVELGQESAFEPAHMAKHLNDAKAFTQKPCLHRIEARDAGDIEGRAEKAAAARCIGHARAPLLQRGESGIPAGIARARAPVWWAMHEADAFARHRIFVTAGEI